MAAWVVYKKYTNSKYPRYYCNTDIRGFNKWSTRQEDAEQMSMARARRIAQELGGRCRKIV